MAIWDSLTSLAKKIPNPIYNLGSSLASSLQNSFRQSYANTLPATPRVTTATERAAMALKNKPAAQPDLPMNTSNTSYSGSYGASPFDYNASRATAEANVSKAYDPLRNLLQNEVSKGIPKRYEEQINTTKERLPLNQRKYQALLDQLEQVTAAQKTDIKGQEASALGAAGARAGARGLYDSSVLAGGEQRISKDAMQALIDAEDKKKLAGEGYSADYALADQGVFEALSGLYNQKEGDIANTLAKLYGIPADMLGSIQNEVGGMQNAANLNADIAYKNSQSSTNKGTFEDYLDPATGEMKKGYFVNGQLVSDIGGAVPGEYEGQVSASMSAMLKNLLADGTLSPEEAQKLRIAFPFQGPNIDALAKQYKPKSSFLSGIFR
jgi:hypothetical protein